MMKPAVDWQVLQRRKLVDMSEIVDHFKEVDGMQIFIQPKVYPPGTDSTLLTRTVRVKPGDICLDLGTGTGVVACRMALDGAKHVLGIDLNPKAIANANKNKTIMKLKNLDFQKGNLFDGIEKKFDVITFNPPYTDKPAANDIEICFFDPGHQTVRKFFSQVKNFLKTDGVAYMTWSNISDMGLLPRLAAKNKYSIKQIAENRGGRGYMFYVYKLKTLTSSGKSRSEL